MASELARATPAAPLAAPLQLDGDGARRLYDAWRAGRNANTLRAYEGALADLAGYLAERLERELSPQDALQELLRAGQGGANLAAIDWRANMLERKLSAGTIALRLSALKAAVKMARTLGLVSWGLEIPALKIEKYRDTSGPGLEGVQRIAAAARDRKDVIGARDRALLALLFVQGLRRGEAVSLDAEHVDLEGARIHVLGKGHTEREWVYVAPETAAALRAWLQVRPGPLEGPLLLGWSAVQEAPLGRLTGRGVAKIIARYGRKALGRHVRPHGLRHAAATVLLDLGLAWQEVASFTRHADPSTLRHYDDARKKRGATGARRLAELVKL
jgi:integrase/recombinase XerC